MPFATEAVKSGFADLNSRVLIFRSGGGLPRGRLSSSLAKLIFIFHSISY